MRDEMRDDRVLFGVEGKREPQKTINSCPGLTSPSLFHIPYYYQRDVM
jgi:hypothetical protein